MSLIQFLVLVILSLCSLVQHVHSQVPFGGACPTNLSKPLDDYNSSTYEGMWYLQAGVPTVLEQGKKCIAFNFTTSAGVTTFTEYVVDISTEAQLTYIGTMTVDYNRDIFSLQFRSPLSFTMPVQLMGGDMVTYVIAYICSLNGFYAAEDGGIRPYIYTRLKKPSCVVLEAAYAELESYNISRSYLKVFDQKCTQY